MSAARRRNEDDPLRVLIVDSDNVRRGMLACTLPAARFSLEFARSPERGLDLLSKIQPDVVIVGLDGAASDLCRRIRSLPSGGECLVALMDESFRDEHAGEAAAEAAGADTFLPFPFDPALFEQRIGARWRRSSGAALPSPDNGGGGHAASTTPTPIPPVESPSWVDFRTRVHWFHEHLDTMDYYQLLQVPLSSTPAGIKEAYFRCSMEFHPDRFMQLEDQELKSEIYDIYKRMSEAFKVLFHAEARTVYDAGLAGGQRGQHLRLFDRTSRVSGAEDPTADAATQAGKRYLHFARVAEAEGNLRSARMYLTLALQCEPHNMELRARLEGLTRRLER